jgi:hypothetical protein
VNLIAKCQKWIVNHNLLSANLNLDFPMSDQEEILLVINEVMARNKQHTIVYTSNTVMVPQLGTIPEGGPIQK